MTTQKKYLCSVDMEKSRKELGKGVFSVGLVLAESDGTIVVAKRFSRPVDIDGPEFDESTRQFWKQHPDILARLNADTSKLVWCDVAAHLRGLNETYGPFNYDNFRWICDNPAFDVAQLSLELFLDKEVDVPLSEMFSGYVATSDPTEQYKGLLKMEQAFVDSQLKTPHSHDPVEDATRDIEMMVAIYEVYKRRAEHEEAMLKIIATSTAAVVAAAAAKPAVADDAEESDGDRGSPKKRAHAQRNVN